MYSGVPGSFADGRFLIKREIGKGATGIVYEAFDNERNMRVALKTLIHLDAKSLYHFKQEFRALHDLVHPNLCALMELIEDEGVWFLTMELIEGVDFLKYVRKTTSDEPSPTFEGTRLRSALAGLCQGLNALHYAGKIHRDIKPSNVMVTEDQRVVLLDFGLTADLREASRKDLSECAGTPAYMAPEQAGADQLGPALDWYAVGVMLYEVLTGQLPFTGSSLRIMLDKQTSSPNKPSLSGHAVPEDLEMLCMDLLCSNPQSRPSAAEILQFIHVKKPAPALSPSTELSHQNSKIDFVGRTDELEKLSHLYSQTSAGAFGAVVIEGVSGVGKSSLVNQFTASLLSQDPSVLVLGGRCYERQSAPYKAFDGIIESLIVHMDELNREESAKLQPKNIELLIRVFPSLKRADLFSNLPASPIEIDDPHELQIRAFDALKEILTKLAEHNPLLVVIDDMQWADTDSLSLLKQLFSGDSVPPLLFVLMSRFAQRDEDSVVDWSSLLGRDTARIHLKTLDSHDSAELVRLIVSRDQTHLKVDAASIAVEAAGHPLYIAELIQHIADGGQDWTSLRLDEVIWNRVQTLPEKARYLLETVCVAGIPVEREHLKNLSTFGSEDFVKCVSTLRASNLIRSGGPRKDHLIQPYHDRVRESVVHQVEARGEMPRRHLNIGRFFLSIIAGSELEEKIFFVVQHLRAGSELITDEIERQRLAELYLLAGQKARSSAAYSSSLFFFREGISVLKEGHWNSQYELALRLYEHAADAAYLNSDLTQVYRLSEIVFENARSALDRENVVEVKIRALFAEDNNPEVIRFGIDSLKNLGIVIPPNPGKGALVGALLRAKLSLLGKSDREILNLPQMTEPKRLAVMRILSAMSLSAYVTRPELYAYLIFFQIRFISRFGHSVFSSTTFCSYGLILCGKLLEVDNGYRMGLLAESLMEKYFDRSRLCRLEFLEHGFIRPWKTHFEESRRGLEHAYKRGMDTGDYQYASSACGLYMDYAFFSGLELGTSFRESQIYIEAVTKMNQVFWRDKIIAHQRMMRNFIERVPDPCRLDGEDGSEEALIERFRRDKNETGEFVALSMKAILACYFGAFQKGLESAKRSWELFGSSQGIPTTTMILLCDGIIFLRNLPSRDTVGARISRRITRKIEVEIKRRADHAPMNCLHLLHLLKAEQYRSRGKVARAALCYDRSIASAAKNRFVNAQALAAELAADFFLTEGDRAAARRCAKMAHSAYIAWGARAKVTDVERKYRLAGEKIPQL